MKQAVCVLIIRPELGNLILAIPRTPKSGVPGDYGFPGGKVEPGESLPEAAAREALEETGLTVHWLQRLYVGVDDGGQYEVTTYLSHHETGVITPSAEGRPEWVRPYQMVAEACSFRVYNKAVLDAARIVIDERIAKFRHENGLDK